MTERLILIKESRPMRPEEVKNFNGFIYGYNLENFTIVKKRWSGSNEE